jgi:hypothetical protein
MLHFVQHFCEKEGNLPPCRRRIGLVVPADACWVNDRVSPVILRDLRGGRLDHERHDMSKPRETATAAMDQAIPHVARDIAPFDYAQGRLRQGGNTRSFSRKSGSPSHFFVKKRKQYHAAAGESGVWERWFLSPCRRCNLLVLTPCSKVHQRVPTGKVPPWKVAPATVARCSTCSLS